MVDAGWEIASHGYRWIDYQEVDEPTERAHIARTVEVHEALFGKKPVGMYQGKPNVNTRRLVLEHENFIYGACCAEGAGSLNALSVMCAEGSGR